MHKLSISAFCRRIEISPGSSSSIAGIYVIGSDQLATRHEKPVYLSTDLTSKQYSLTLADIDHQWQEWRIYKYLKGNVKRTIAKSERVPKSGSFRSLTWTVHQEDGEVKEVQNEIKCSGEFDSGLGRKVDGVPFSYFFSVREVTQPDVETLAITDGKKYSDLRQWYEVGSHGKEDFFLLDKYDFACR